MRTYAFIKSDFIFICNLLFSKTLIEEQPCNQKEGKEGISKVLMKMQIILISQRFSVMTRQ